MCLDEFHWANNRYRYTILYIERERAAERGRERELVFTFANKFT